MRISDWSSDVCSSDLGATGGDYIGLVQQKPPANHAVAGAGAADATSCAASLCGGTKVRNRRALVTTNTLESAIAAAPSMGDSSSPKAGYSRPAATGIRNGRASGRERGGQVG